MAEQTQEVWTRWRALLAEQQKSGQSVAAFCRERGLRDGQFYDWKKRLRRHEAESFVAVEIAATETPAAPLPATPVPSAVIEIRLRRGRSLLVGPDFEAGHRQRLLQVLETEP
jgi:hypothetical protein